MRSRLILLVVFLFCLSADAQKGFQFETSKDKVVIPFQLINNLIFIPVTVNGVELNFLLDTGVEETILLSLEDKTEVNFFNVQKIMLKGLGGENAIEGMRSSNNVVSVKGIVDKSHDLYIVLDQSFNFSSHVGIPVNGIIGYHFFKDNLVEINYDRRKLIVYRDNPKRRKRIEQKYTAFPMTVEKSKPYMIADITVGEQTAPAKLLLDLGNSDALWLFETSKNFRVPQKHFEDYLGKGFSGDIYGDRARIAELKMDRFVFSNPIIAFPDSASVKSVNMVKDRAGSIGGEILKRFDIVMDYAQHTIYLRRGNFYSEVFHYNMSGIELQNDGMQWVQETVDLQTVFIDNTYDESGKKNSFKYKFSLKPVYSISNIRKDSPAELCGLQKGDVVVSINSTQAYRLTLQSINQLLKSEDGKWIYVEIDRSGQILKFRFQLKSIL
jgi:hypothetical protein